ncbi:MAG: hypothetical protein DRR16_16750 [Candidatus Parabeggiatoa sp. nov. 3]|jgi:hypothetical protein|nr:MAG: hypothetical protein DRR00_07170 [Gammaproteobacteria bacterium]RKZ63334.1 MAG: hypothetical protein DRQ99_17315 [Gammaproteobacteria bacterium]RKZ83652.1 MAG: hypothetical protein DRR16_16750 [Gammaproteobacteria bacterium]HEW99004.1 hypothetical protein [Beggiatoa sp.]
MKVQVRFRFNKTTGEVEEFLIDEQGSQLSQVEHNREHDRIAHEIGRVVARHPGIQEINPGHGPSTDNLIESNKTPDSSSNPLNSLNRSKSTQ